MKNTENLAGELSLLSTFAWAEPNESIFVKLQQDQARIANEYVPVTDSPHLETKLLYDMYSLLISHMRKQLRG